MRRRRDWPTRIVNGTRLAGALCILYPLCFAATEARHTVLNPEDFRHHIEFFNAMVAEDVVNFIPNAQAWEWIKQNVPLLSCPDPDVERTYYYRWWSFRKHIKRTPAGFIITEFLRPVKHATDYNAISCALGHHISEGRWVRDRRYIDDYVRFWLRGGPGGGLHPQYHKYSNWTAFALYERYLVDLHKDFVTGLLDALVRDYEAWEQERLLPSGLFWQYDVRDGMEETISGSRREKNARPTINSYMYGNACAIASLAALAGHPQLARTYEDKARRLKTLVQSRLWDSQAQFFKVLLESGRLAGVREIMGYTPWYFCLPDKNRGYEVAWKQLMDPQGFFAPFGPTTAEQRHPEFRIAEEGDDCQWNGPSWPFATTQTLKALANLLQRGPTPEISSEDYFQVFMIYTKSHRLRLADGRLIPWVDENLNPFTGEWHARNRKIKKNTFYGRGDHYNHSAYCDLVISGLIGLRPREDNVMEIHPLLPASAWDWFALDGVFYHGKTLAVVWDRTGKKFGRGKGFAVLADGQLVARSERLQPLRGRL